jgi:hypothetical protein
MAKTMTRDQIKKHLDNATAEERVQFIVSALQQGGDLGRVVREIEEERMRAGKAPQDKALKTEDTK